LKTLAALARCCEIESNAALQRPGDDYIVRQVVDERDADSSPLQALFGGALDYSLKSFALLPKWETMISLITFSSELWRRNLFGIINDSGLPRTNRKYRGLSTTLRTLSQAIWPKFFPRTISKPSAFS
jgi:hypothetical protein